MSPESQLFKSQIQRLIIKLFKNHLNSLDDIRQEHLQTLALLSNKLDNNDLKQFNYLDLEKYSKYRKNILDSGNETIRDINNLLDNFDISLKK